MKMPFNSSLYLEDTGGEPYRAKHVDWVFASGGHTHVIPVVYVFQTGLILDIITPLDADVVYAHWHETMNAGTEIIPHGSDVATTVYGAVPFTHITLDGQLTCGQSTTSMALYVPWAAELATPAVMQLIHTHAVLLSMDDCFTVQRCLYEGPVDMNHLDRLGIMLDVVERLLPFHHSIRLYESDGPTAFAFIHPRTYHDYVLHMHAEQVHSSGLYTYRVQYATTPRLAPGEHLQLSQGDDFCSGAGDGPAAVGFSHRMPRGVSSFFGRPTAAPSPCIQIEIEGLWVPVEPAHVVWFERAKV